MRYYDSFQIYSAYDDWAVEETLLLTEKCLPTAISGPANMIRELHNNVDHMFEAQYGVIVLDNNYRELKLFSRIEPATADDAKEIAVLMYSDKVFSTGYCIDVLTKQIYDRLNSGFGRSFIIRDNGRIVAHIGTFAEIDDIAVVSGLIVDEKYKKSFYGITLYEYIKKVLRAEGFNIYGMRFTENMLLNAKASDLPLCDIGKLSAIRFK
jgi:hypothetical protein